MKGSNRKNVSILSFALIVVMLGYGMVIPIFPFFIERLGAGGRYLGLLIASYAFMQFLFAPIWGSVSDRYGRKPVLILGMFGNALTLLLMGLSDSLWTLLLFRTLSGILSSATLPTSMAYISDSTTEEERGGGIGIMGAAMGLGVILGPGLGGLLAAGSLSQPFFIASALSVVSLLLILFLLPESLPERSRVEAGSAIRAVQFGNLLRALSSSIGILLIMAFLVSFGLTNFEAVFGLYGLEKFDYGPQEIGIILMVIGLVSTIAQGVLTGPITKRWGEVKVIRVSLLASSVGFLILLLPRSYLAVLMTTGFFILTKTFLRPAIISLTSKRSTGGQGAAMGLSNSFMSLGRIAGPMWAGFLFDYEISYPYLSGAVIMFVGFLMSLVWIKQEASETAVIDFRPVVD